MEQKEVFSWKEVTIDRNIKWFQEQYSPEKAKREYLSRAAPCPSCKSSADQLSWFYYPCDMHPTSSFITKRGWVTVCDRCKLQVDFFVEEQEIFPWEKVTAFKNDKNLQSQHSSVHAMNRFLGEAAPCPRCRTVADGLLWIYLSYQDGWPRVAGWLTVCERCNLQVDFFIMQKEYFPKDWLKKKISVEQAKTDYLEALLAQMIRGDELWEFSSPEESWNALAGRAGIALVRNGKIIDAIITKMS